MSPGLPCVISLFLVSCPLSPVSCLCSLPPVRCPRPSYVSVPCLPYSVSRLCSLSPILCLTSLFLVSRPLSFVSRLCSLSPVLSRDLSSVFHPPLSVLLPLTTVQCPLFCGSITLFLSFVSFSLIVCITLFLSFVPFSVAVLHFSCLLSPFLWLYYTVPVTV